MFTSRAQVMASDFNLLFSSWLSHCSVTLSPCGGKMVLRLTSRHQPLLRNRVPVYQELWQKFRISLITLVCVLPFFLA